MNKYVIEEGGSVIWPPATIIASMVKSIFISNIKWHLLCWYPTGTFSSSFRTLKYSWKCLNYLLMALLKRLFTFWSSSLKASSKVLGIWMPNLWVRFQQLTLTLDIIQSRLLSVSGVHHLKDDYVVILFATSCSTLIKGYHFLRSFNGFQDVSPPFHLTINYQPFAIQHMCLLPFLQWYSYCCS